MNLLTEASGRGRVSGDSDRTAAGPRGREELCSLLPRELAERHGVVPWSLSGRTLRVLTGDPPDLAGLDALRHLLDLEIEASVAPSDALAGARERVYGGNSSPAKPEPAAAPDESSAVAMADGIIREAIRRRASDIHVEPLEHRLRLRYRIDGVLVEVEDLPKPLQAALVSRLKLMADISIAERRVPQDGRIEFRHEDRTIDLRVAALPTAHGESVVMRILDPTELRPGLLELGLAEDDRNRLERLIARPNGLVLVTGPTGSGKTTTLYTCLRHLNHCDRKLITVEDPVEYQLEGVNQVPVRPGAGLTFAAALRAMLRQAPDTIMVGEIRDPETAEIALHAALTGHLVFSTLHTNDVPGAISRLLDLGVKPYLLSAALRAVLAQRLVRKVCPKCRRAQAPGESESQVLGRGMAPGGAGYWQGSGCAECSGTGYLGRIGIFELLEVDEEFSQMIHDRAPPARLRVQARARGLRTLREDGLRQAIAGLTTIEEVVFITAGDSS